MCDVYKLTINISIDVRKMSIKNFISSHFSLVLSVLNLTFQDLLKINIRLRFRSIYPDIHKTFIVSQKTTRFFLHLFFVFIQSEECWNTTRNSPFGYLFCLHQCFYQRQVTSSTKTATVSFLQKEYLFDKERKETRFILFSHKKT